MSISKNQYHDLMTGRLFIMGILKFMPGLFAMSTLSFGAVSLSSRFDFARPARAKA
ncbi:hypothetical protein [Methylomonas methanica]|uniref:Uncharacterized protein n=1 Tax=Methylomonas methanica (strain DSM 25384 / MC09) TaxID=857087 RepID=G0A694_METMM|nr:hypothetical protein [Methylomonas methanica]AEG01722.1 hypothetical protein Metme_3351 [Methylomonas methanica MC09]